MADWVIVKDIKHAFPPRNEHDKFYTVVCKSGRTKIAFPDTKRQYPVWNTLNGGGGNNIFPEDVVAYQELDIPRDIIDIVLANERTSHTPFAKFYK